MSWLLFIIASLVLGHGFVAVLKLKDEPWWLQHSAAVVAGTLGGAWLSLLLSWITRSSTAGICLSIGVMLAVGYPLWRMRYHIPRVPTRYTSLLILVVGLVFFVAYLHAPYTSTAGSLYAHGYAWSDLPLHMSIASFFREQPRPLLQLPLLPDTALTYPFLFDWQAAVLLRLGASYELAFALPSAMLLIAGCALSFGVVRKLLQSVRAAALHLGLFLGLGSAAGGIVLLNAIVTGTFSWFTDYSNIDAQNLNFANVVTSHFLPQRTFLLGFAGVMLALYLLRRVYEAKEWASLPWIALGIAALPFTHIYSGALVAVWLIALSCIWWREEKARKWIGISLGILVAGMAPQLWWQLSHVPSGFGHLKLGWMWNGEGSLVWFWVRQLGFTLALILGGLWFIRRSIKDAFGWIGIVGGIVLLIIGNSYIAQPNEFDNLKFMLYGFWMLLIPAADLLARWSRRQRALVIAAFVLSTAVGAYTIVRDVLPATGYELFTSDDRAALMSMQEIIPIDATVATAERHNNVIAALGGRRVLSGYSGWLWSYGLSYTAPLQAQKAIIQGKDDGTLATQYNVTYIAINLADAEQGAYPGVLSAKYPLLYSGYGWYLYSATPN